MKNRSSLLVFWAFITFNSPGQVGINSSNNSANPSAGVDVDFATKGFLPPRMTTSQILAISNPATGLITFNKTTNKPVWFDGSNWRNFDATFAWFGCGTPLEIIHIAGPVAPVNKTVIYGTVSGIPGETDKCWITSNLGSDHQASSQSDDTEESAGWYWKFNRKQGYKHDGSTIFPNLSIPLIMENSDWLAGNDPCSIELGSGWYIPTLSEWFNVITAGGWTTGDDLWNSALKMHSAGIIDPTNELLNRGYSGAYWSCIQNSSTAGQNLDFYSFYEGISLNFSDKNAGYSIRCVNCLCSSSLQAPVEGNHTESSNWIQWEWIPSAGAGMYKWNTSSDFSTAIDMGVNTSWAESGLVGNTSYTRYVWKYDRCGHTAMKTLTATTISQRPGCGDTLLINHIAGPVAPVNKTVHYGTVADIPGEPDRCWITSNLGSDHQATFVNDSSEASAGWYWQFGKKQGFKHNGLARTPDSPWITSIDTNSDWTSSQDPCRIELGTSWRIPTFTEWDNLMTGGGWEYNNGAWNSALKIHTAGLLQESDGQLSYRGTYGCFWSSQQLASINAYYYLSSPTGSGSSGMEKTNGFSIRCLKCLPFTSLIDEGLHTVSSNWVVWKWNRLTSATGYKWNTSNDYNSSVDLGDNNTKQETGLAGNTSYTRYVWAYDECGHSEVTFLNVTTANPKPGCGNTLLINHVAGSVAPVSKTVSYTTVTDIPGEPDKCWITHNLGADRQADSINDISETAAGWYWQFGNKQGFKHDGTTRTPATTWIPYIEASSDWTSLNDPCTIELGSPWRIPTATEWSNYMLGEGWTTWYDPWNSILKIHAAGALDDNLIGRGNIGTAWSSTHISEGWSVCLFYEIDNPFFEGLSNMENHLGFSMRCLKCLVTNAIQSPGEGSSVPSFNRIVWNWNPVTEAAGYKWNTTNDYNSAEDMGTATSREETGLVAATSYTRFVWAYYGCGNSIPLQLTASTLSFTCGADSLIIEHLAGAIAPVSKTVTYHTTDNIPGGQNKCWITSNLGSEHPASSVSDPSEASAGWYWQFGVLQGYQHDGSGRIPNTAWVSAIDTSSNWLSSKDPCTILLGSDWRIPTASEWFNVLIGGGWINWTGPWDSSLKLHAAGLLSNSTGSLESRGVYGRYWSNTQQTSIFGWSLNLGNDNCNMNTSHKSYGYPIRCIWE